MTESDDQWEEEDCSTCKFRSDRVCRHSPPSGPARDSDVAGYPVVKLNSSYLVACAQYEPRA